MLLLLFLLGCILFSGGRISQSFYQYAWYFFTNLWDRLLRSCHIGQTWRKEILVRSICNTPTLMKEKKNPYRNNNNNNLHSSFHFSHLRRLIRVLHWYDQFIMQLTYWTTSIHSYSIDSFLLFLCRLHTINVSQFQFFNHSPLVLICMCWL